MRYVKYIFISFLAILLMSHNTFAVDFSYNVRLYTTSAIRSVYDSAGYSNSNGIFVDMFLSGSFGGKYNDVSVSDGMLVEVPVMVFNAVENNAVDGYVMADEVDCGYISCQLVGFTQSGGSSSTVFHFYLYISSNGTLNDIVFTKRNGYALRLYQNERAVMPFISVFRFVDNSSSQPVVPDLSTINNYIVQINNKLQNIYDRLGNLSENIPSADEIADAINEPEQQATDNISGQSQDDIDTGDDSSATNLIGNISNIFTQIGNIPVGSTCSVPADFGHIDLGNINFCTGKDKMSFVITFGAYCFELIFVIGTGIILVKQLLGILDWARQ